jgi:hypothetical protein
MTTIPSTVEKFNKACAKFLRIIGDKKHTPEQVKGAHKALTLLYLCLPKDTEKITVEACAMHLHIATQGAIARGWLQ